MDRGGKFLGVRFCAVVGGILLVFAAAHAQLPTATILGVIKDSTGAVIPGANIIAKNVNTGLTRTAVASADGSYRLPALPVGNYEVRVEHQGFQSAVQSGLTLTVSQEAVVNFSLQVGAIEQTVSVTAEAPLVNTTSGSLGGLVSEQKVADLPLNGRNFIDLTLLQTGVAQHKNISFVAGMSGTWFSSNGAPLRSNNYLLDGALMQNLYGASTASTSGSTLGIEGIREYRVVTNSFSAEYGLTMGSQMVIVSKSGTNAFHGSMFEYLRNSALDARNFFDRKTASNPRRLPAFTRNNFGGSAGGPIKKDKTMFFAVYEGLRERLGATKNSTSIGAGCRGSAGAVITNSQCPQLGPQTPSVAISPSVAPLLALYPAPNLDNNQITFPFSQPTREDYGQARGDHTFSSSDTMFGRFTIDDTEVTLPLAFPQFRVINSSRNLYTTLSEDHVFSPSLLNTARYSYSRTRIRALSPSGISGPQFSFVPGKEIGDINIAGIFPLGPDSPDPVDLRQNVFTWSDDMFYTRGRQSFKFGTLINHYQQFMQVSTLSTGTVNFADLGSFLAGRPISFQAVTPGSVLDRTYHLNSLGFYIQDDLRMRSNFTLNLGLRYEFITQPEETKGHGAAVRDIQHDAQPTLGAPFVNPSRRNFSPRFGFAWDVKGDGRTSVRGGFGLLYDVGNLASALVVGTTATPPFSRQSVVSNPTSFTIPFTFPESAAGRALRTVDYHIQQPHMLQYNLTVERQLPGRVALTLAYGGSRGINIVQTTDGNPRIALGTPVGNACVPAATRPALNGPHCWLGNEPRTNPNWANVEFKEAGGSSWYNSLQFGVSKQLSHGLQFQSSYTWAKVLDETQSQLAAENNASNSFASDPSNIKLDKGPAAFDVTHNWRFNAIYRFHESQSLGTVARKLLNGWWTSGILSLQTGYPFSPALGSNRSRSLVNGGPGGIDRPNVNPGRNNDNIILGRPDRYFDPAAFSIQPAGFLGNAARNMLRGPGFATLDFSVVKDTGIGALGEGGKLEFRAEFFNILNRANFTTPGLGQSGGNNAAIVFAGTADVQAPLPTVGRITSTASTSRQIQFALKLLF